MAASYLRPARPLFPIFFSLSPFVSPIFFRASSLSHFLRSFSFVVSTSFSLHGSSRATLHSCCGILPLLFPSFTSCAALFSTSPFVCVDHSAASRSFILIGHPFFLFCIYRPARHSVLAPDYTQGHVPIRSWI